jgi:FAD dependent oxidoreductase TIGR03364
VSSTSDLGHFDVAVVGAGIVGLSHALAAAKRGKRVVVIERDARSNGASIRNFGFVTVTGQQAGACWQRAMRSRHIWADVAAKAGITVEHAGLLVVARRPEARDVLEAFAATDMGRACRLLAGNAMREKVPAVRHNAVAALWSPHELRIESRTAILKLATWLEDAHGVAFLRSTLVKDVTPPRIETTRGTVFAESAIICAGHDFQTLFSERIADYKLTTCKLQMLRVSVPAADFRLGAAVMSDLGLVRYLGYAELPEAKALKQRLHAEQANALDNGVHLIAVQSADGSLVVGDSHHYGETADPFASDRVDQLIMDEFDQVLALPGRVITERWVGVYASAADQLMLVDRPSDAIRLVIVTSGTGASTAFAIGEEVVSELYGELTEGENP